MNVEDASTSQGSNTVTSTFTIEHLLTSKQFPAIDRVLRSKGRGSSGEGAPSTSSTDLRVTGGRQPLPHTTEAPSQAKNLYTELQNRRNKLSKHELQHVDNFAAQNVPCVNAYATLIQVSVSCLLRCNSMTAVVR